MTFSFFSTKTRRNINSFYNYTKNLFFFKRLYLYNLNTYIYIMNSINLESTFNFFFITFFTPFIILKYSMFDFIVVIYISYIFLIIFLLFINKLIHITTIKSNIKTRFNI